MRLGQPKQDSHPFRRAILDFRGFMARNRQQDRLTWHGQMSLSETTRKVLGLVEERSGIPVHVEPDLNLPGTLLAKVVMARDNLPLHRVFAGQILPSRRIT